MGEGESRTSIQKEQFIYIKYNQTILLPSLSNNTSTLNAHPHHHNVNNANA
ncbi:hypothetical protein [Piscirickettsia salmonis]|uniref:hypothetical protein n=1 Tax=Piscirickettsia salmonis TaxID=1238 RepID=UPI0002D92706|nr:hypothetical protein [Piscirickettsia salmonis]ERL62893.1 hypothetical protein K661_00752 [Piscirickettsia salmonis LF-89 = ATCC VR-1361]QNR79519.1 hypothetical protein ICC15_10745 [Piscirickettsia salmonis]